MYIIDRMEEDFAVIETDDGFLDIPRSELPDDADAGAVLRLTEGGWELDTETAAQRKASLAERRRRLLNGGSE